MLTIITTFHILAALAIIALVLLQQGKGADAGAAFGAGGSGTVFGARGAASFLTRTTAALAVVFFLTSLGLAWLASQQVERRSVVERTEAPAESGPVPASTSDVPAASGRAGVGRSDGNFVRQLIRSRGPARGRGRRALRGRAAPRRARGRTCGESPCSFPIPA